MMRTTGSRIAVSALVAGLGACEGQATPNYQGVPLAQIQGTISTGPSSVTPSDLVAGVSWVKPIEDAGSATALACGGQIIINTGPAPIEVPVNGSFPAQFTLNIFTPPPAEMISKTWGRATGKLVVFEKSTGKVWGTTTPDAELVYVTASFRQGGVWPADFCTNWQQADYWSNNAHSPGYYLLQATKDCAQSGGALGPGWKSKGFEEASSGLATEVTIDVKAPPSEPAKTGPCPMAPRP
jgi:hypothetical protein